MVASKIGNTPNERHLEDLDKFPERLSKLFSLVYNKIKEERDELKNELLNIKKPGLSQLSWTSISKVG